MSTGNKFNSKKSLEIIAINLSCKKYRTYRNNKINAEL